MSTPVYSNAAASVLGVVTAPETLPAVTPFDADNFLETYRGRCLGVDCQAIWFFAQGPTVPEESMECPVCADSSAVVDQDVKSIDELNPGSGF